jgi:sporulation protein YlmC with PRC-barrel domain
MEFKDGINVTTADGKDAGKLFRVVIDPLTLEVTHIVIQRGVLFKDNKVIVREAVASATLDGLSLTCTEDELNGMSPLEIEQIAPISELYGRGQKYEPLPGGTYSPPALSPSLVKEITRTISDELVPVKTGAQVLAEDGTHLGNIEVFTTAPETNKVMRLMVAQGLFLKARKSIPVEWVKRFDEDLVELIVGATQLEELPDQQS